MNSTDVNDTGAIDFSTQDPGFHLLRLEGGMHRWVIADVNECLSFMGEVPVRLMAGRCAVDLRDSFADDLLRSLRRRTTFPEVRAQVVAGGLMADLYFSASSDSSGALSLRFKGAGHQGCVHLSADQSAALADALENRAQLEVDGEALSRCGAVITGHSLATSQVGSQLLGPTEGAPEDGRLFNVICREGDVIVETALLSQLYAFVLQGRSASLQGERSLVAWDQATGLLSLNDTGLPLPIVPASSGYSWVSYGTVRAPGVHTAWLLETLRQAREAALRVVNGADASR